MAGAAGILFWLLQGNVTSLEWTLAGVCALVSLMVLVSIWRKSP
jgi:hypothetical protein